MWTNNISLLIAYIQTNGDLSKNGRMVLETEHVNGAEEIKDDEVNVKMGGMKVKRVKSKKILGLVVDDKLTFHEHIKQKTSAAFQPPMVQP